jgi:hypothetical protein
LLFFETCSLGYSWTLILFSLALKCWSCRHVPLCLAFFFFFWFRNLLLQTFLLELHQL